MEARYRIMVEKLAEMHPDWELDIEPPPDGPAAGVARQPRGPGLIRYAFSSDEQKPCLEFYSFHRIWGDLHGRIYESGKVQHLDVLETMLEVTGDPDEDRRAREEQDRRNRMLIEHLEAAGLLSGGPVPGSFAINAAIVTGGVEAGPPRSDPDEGDLPGDEGGRTTRS